MPISGIRIRSRVEINQELNTDLRQSYRNEPWHDLAGVIENVWGLFGLSIKKLVRAKDPQICNQIQIRKGHIRFFLGRLPGSIKDCYLYG